ncbi:MAG: sterol desaturase family protein [Proteobacteria bacterium]|nr:sterol desaturase family protein [Pseudomonadota bacterium]HQR03700.1 sterol desaturase family protein [Rhodocyclaceae bacterium]
MTAPSSPGPGRALLALVGYPLILAQAIAFAIWLDRNGFAAGAIVGYTSLVTIALVTLSERLIPFRPDWNQNQGDFRADMLHNIFSAYLMRELCKAVLRALLASGVIAIAASQDGGVWSGLAEQWPFALQVVLVLVIAEFTDYWMHRISHEVEFFWRFHALHHSPLRLYWLNAGRDHPGETLLFYLSTSVPLVLLGTPPKVLLMFYVIESALGLLQHANAAFRLGPLNWIFSTADLHRWHHSLIVAEANSNYGSNLIIWDTVFGTRTLPHLGGPDRIGVETPYITNRWRDQLMVPFRWRRLVTKAPGA